jgi:uncharacterized LabA/DUF88 family protein
MRKANIFIDWLNIRENGGRSLDFKKLIKAIEDKDYYIQRINLYAPPHDDNQLGFYDVIRKNGIKIVLIPGKSARGDKGDSYNCDALMAVDMVTQSNDVDTVCLLSNDADFIPAVEYLQMIGKRVELYHADHPSNLLRTTVDKWHYIVKEDLLKEIAKENSAQPVPLEQNPTL